jgi:hypothetical protein
LDKEESDHSIIGIVLSALLAMNCGSCDRYSCRDEARGVHRSLGRWDNIAGLDPAGNTTRSLTMRRTNARADFRTRLPTLPQANETRSVSPAKRGKHTPSVHWFAGCAMSALTMNCTLCHSRAETRLMSPAANTFCRGLCCQFPCQSRQGRGPGLGLYGLHQKKESIGQFVIYCEYDGAVK